MSIKEGDKFTHISNDSKFSHNIMTVIEVGKDNSKREREDVVYFKTQIPVDGETEHDARAWWFLDYCIKIV